MKNNNMGVDELYLAPEQVKQTDMAVFSDTSETETPELLLAKKALDNSKKPERIEEIREQRGTNHKVFRMSDGTEQAVFSPSFIHVFDDETQTFEDVESTLTEDEDGKHFTCGKNHFVAKFSREEDNDDLFSIEQGVHKVFVYARKNKKNKNKGVKPHLHKNLRKGIDVADILTFADVEPDTDYEYAVQGDGVKENIIVKKPSDIYRYPFTLRCENVTAHFDEDAMRVCFVSKESGKEVFYIPAPFMTDANGISSAAANFEVRTTDSGLVHFSVTADAEWMNASNRAFPVTIDPQIKLADSASISTYSWENGLIHNDSLHKIGTVPTQASSGANTPSDTSSTSNTMKTAIQIALNTWQSGRIGCCYDEVWYKFVANSANAHVNGNPGEYTIYTQGSLDTMGSLYDSRGNLLTNNDDIGSQRNFRIVTNLTKGATYYLKVRAWGDNTGSYNVIVTGSGDSIINSGTGSHYANRMYMSFAMPTLPRNPRIKKAELQLFQSSSVSEFGVYPLIGLYKVTDPIYIGSCTPANSADLIDFAKMRMGHTQDGEVVSYTFDITSLLDTNESSSCALVLKMINESINAENNITLYGSSYGNSDYKPKIVITYESSYGVNTSYRTHTHELGRFGQGSVDLQCGNLMFESEDFAWSGNRMPVTIKHLYNSALAGYTYTNNNAIKLATASFSAMNVGLGFKLNLMQSMIFTNFIHEGEPYGGYVYIGENGEETFFKESAKQECYDDNSQCYNLFEDVNGGDMLYDPVKRTLTQGEDTYQFDTFGRLIKITDTTKKNHIEITYTANRISTVTDGAERDFSFDYNSDGQLTSITAPDGTYITYTYTDNLLTGISYPDDKYAEIAYSSNKPVSVTLRDAGGLQVYKVAYTFEGDRLASVTEYGSNDSVCGASSTYSYSVASARTLVTTTEQKDTDEGETADNVITTTYTFDHDGNIASEYVYSTDTGKVGGDGEESGINPHSGDGGAGVVSNINNLLTNHSFESLSTWWEMPANCGEIHKNNDVYLLYTKFGKKALYMYSRNKNAVERGVYQVTNTLPKGQYTFSAYLRVLSAFSGTNAGAFIRVTDTAGNVLGVSERLTNADSEYTRLIVPFSLATSQSVQVQILVNGQGSLYADAAQLENNPYANAYNILENGNFERGTSDWTCSSGVYSTTGTCFNMSKSLYMSGALEADRYAYQAPVVRTDIFTRETFTLSGWAKGKGLPNHERADVEEAPRFRLRAEIKYTGVKETENHMADFSPCTEDWQFASVQFAKQQCKEIEYLRVYCDYGYNSGDAYFDDIQLVRNSLETGLSSGDFNADDIDTVAQSTEASNAAVEESADAKTAFEEAKDDFGNALTETTFTDGDFGTIYRAFKFNEDDGDLTGNDVGNNLVEETDARGYKTTYTVSGDSSRNEEVIDRLGNKTAYEYDDSGRTTKVTSKDATDKTLAHVSYAYDTFDNMTEIVRGDDMKYALAYNEFHNLESIGIDGKTEKLIQYTYKNGNGRLKEMKYANGDTMKATYNAIGQMVAETWYDKNGVETARYKYVYDGEGNIVRSIDIKAEKEYNYEYEEGRIIRATEADIELTGEIVTAKVIVNTVKYYYDAEGKMTKKVITPEGGSAQTIYYETNDDSTTVKFSAGGRTVTSHSKTDSFGRKVFDELQLGTGFVSRQFSYMPGAITEAHREKQKIKSTATTQLVSQIALSDGRTISYEYDNEERIIKVDDSINGTVEYTYDALGQLKTETKNNQTTKFEYDNYGNITAKGIVDANGNIAEATKISYVYGNDSWKDLLTSYNGQEIHYDTQGNPLTYLGRTLTWEKGRQLKKLVKSDGTVIDYTYNANGIRTSKTVGGVKHTYTLDGTKILRETWGSNTLIPLYDNEDSVCGILYNGTPYYFIKNLQGDVIAIVNKDAETVARYSYDAWGVCTVTLDSVGIATINPFRYKEYYYDSETALYYLQSRYYNATVGRFLNSDDIENLEYLNGPLDLNLFTYTVNCPIILTDGCGEGWLKDKIKKVVNKVKKAVTTVVGATKKVVSTVKNGIKTVCTSVGDFFKNTVWKKWLVNGVWNTFCKKWVWEKFCKEMVYNTFIKKWVWETFCKKWTWETFCKKWVWQTFCKKWVWETFCKDWMADKAWNWLKSNWKSVVDWFMAIGGGASAVVSILMAVGLFSIPVAGQIALGVFGIVAFVWTVIRLLGF